MAYPKKPMLGKRFGRLLVTEDAGARNGDALWKCLCDCGTEKVISSSHLRRGHIRSCGCYRKDFFSAGISLVDFVPPDSADWRPIKNFEGKYWISDDGRVFTALRGNPHVMIQSPDHNGYPKVVFQVGNKKINFSVHVLVAGAFLGDKPERLQINHKDGIKTHNSWTNLEYVTAKENVNHAQELGLRRKKAAA